MWLTTGSIGGGRISPHRSAPRFRVALASGLLRGGALTWQRFIFTVYGLASLGRVVLHVQSGGVYASYLLPAAVVIFTYLWVGLFASRFRDARASRVACTTCLGLLVGVALVYMVGLAYRYRARNMVAVATARGIMITGPEMGWRSTRRSRTLTANRRERCPCRPARGDVLNFLSGRRNPLREEIVDAGLSRCRVRGARHSAVARCAHRADRHSDRSTPEFGRAAFGRDDRQRRRAGSTDYTPCAIFAR